MKLVKEISLVFAVLISTGCASGLNSMQKREYAAFQYDGVLIEEKKPSVGVALGLLPGGGSFYVRAPGPGVVNLLFWPLSILWDPVSGYDGAMSINYDITKHHLKKEKGKELSALDEKLSLGEIDNKAYLLSKRGIDQKYDFE